MQELIKKRLGNKKGFTLIELIVVIAIIAILAAVLLPRFIGFTADAKKNAAVSDARNILVAVEAMQTQGDASITSTDIANYTGKTFPGTVADSSGTTVDTSHGLGSDSFYYTSSDGNYRVYINAGQVSTTFTKIAALDFTQQSEYKG